MEVASLPAEEGPVSASAQGSHHGVSTSKRLLQGRPLPAILVDENHPSPRYPTFRPHQRRLSQQKGVVGKGGGGGGGGGEGGGVDGPQPPPLPSSSYSPRDSGVSFGSPEGDLHPPFKTSTSSYGLSHNTKTSRNRNKKSRRGVPVATPAGASASLAAGGLGTTTTTATTTSNTSGGAATTTTSTGGATTTAFASSSGGVGGMGGGGGGGGGGGQGQGHLMSSTSSGVSSFGLSITTDQLHRKGAQKANSRLGQVRAQINPEGADYYVNPEPVPFMPSNFIRIHGLPPYEYPRSSTMLKKIPIPKRHQDTFGGYEYNFTGQRGVMLHTDRYQVRKQYEALKSLEGLNQRDRLLAELAYLEDLRSIRRRREMVPHRVQLDLFLGGKKLGYEERFDIKREIQRLKAMVMPSRARDLFHGKGIQLPATHLSVLPRPSRGPGEDSDSEEDFRISAPASLQRTMGASYNMDLPSPTFERQISLTLGDVPHASSVVRNKRPRLPSISKNQTPRGVTGVSTPGSAEYPQVWGSLPVSFSLSRRRDTTLLHTRHRPHRAVRDDTSLSASQASGHQTSRSAAWVEEQNQLLSRSQPGSPETAGSVTGESRTGTGLELQIHLPSGSRVHDDDPDLDREGVAKEDVVKVKESRLAPSRPLPATTTTTKEKEKETKQQPQPEEPAPSSQGPAALPGGLTGPSASEDVSPGPAVQTQQSASSRGGGPGGQNVQIVDGDAHSADTPDVPPVSHTPNPLKAGMFMDVSEEQKFTLRQTFQRLDTDMDGHLQYHQLKSQLPKEFSRQQEWFVKQVYEITSSSGAFFGVDEFLMMTQLTNRVASLTGQAQESYGKIDFDTLEGCIIKYVDLFQQGDSSQRGWISADSLRQLLGQSQDKPAPEETSRLWNTILDSLSLDYALRVNRIEYLAHIPLFMTLAPPTPPPPPPQSYQSTPLPEI